MPAANLAVGRDLRGPGASPAHAVLQVIQVTQAHWQLPPDPRSRAGRGVVLAGAGRLRGHAGRRPSPHSVESLSF